MKNPVFDAVLFDLDGTLVDSAPDLAAAGNEMRLARNLAALPLEIFRPMVGSGARGMVGMALGKSPIDPEFPELRDEFLQRYERRLSELSIVFEAIVPVLKALDDAGVRWGVVTNKATRFAVPLSRALGLDTRAAALVCGDTTPHSKPHPAPLLEAARLMEVPAGQCLYVGDDLRDVQAGLAAGMSTAAAAWGYLGQGPSILEWGADHVLNVPADLLNLLQLP